MKFSFGNFGGYNFFSKDSYNYTKRFNKTNNETATDAAKTNQSDSKDKVQESDSSVKAAGKYAGSALDYYTTVGNYNFHTRDFSFLDFISGLKNNSSTSKPSSTTPTEQKPSSSTPTEQKPSSSTPTEQKPSSTTKPKDDVYKNGKIQIKYYDNGNYRVYKRVEKGNDKNPAGTLISSTTYRQDGSKYTEETFVPSDGNPFNGTSRPYAERTFYNKNGEVDRVEQYTYHTRKDGLIEKTIYVDGVQTEVKILDKDRNEVKGKKVEDAPEIKHPIKKDAAGNEIAIVTQANVMTVTVTGKDGKIKSQSEFILNSDALQDGKLYYEDFSKNDIDKIKEIRNYVPDENGKLVLKTTWKSTGINANGVQTSEREYYTYNSDGSKEVRLSKVNETYNSDDGDIAANNVSQESTLEYNSNGKLVRKTVYSGFNDYSQAGDEFAVKMPQYKTVYEYDENEKIKERKRERYEYDLKAGTKTVYKQKRVKDGDGYKYVDDESKEVTTENIKQDHNPNNVTGEDVVNLAKSYIGYKRANGDQFLFGTHGAWCSGFATFIYMELGVDLSMLQNRFRTRSVYSVAVAEGRFTATSDVDKENADKLVGQFVLFAGDDGLQHIGIVESVTVKNKGKKEIKIIEGNSVNQVIQRKYIVDENGNIEQIIPADERIDDGKQIVGFADFLS